ncbi:MAG: serine/threonine protein kinase [Anaerolineales bacterium]|nr:serine/threonine protein kinase [Anaerolineales bacterium]
MAPASLEGQTIGKYRILEPLGRGGMAQVYKAYHPQLDRYVAVKVLRSDLVEEVEFLARFRREARSVAALRQANIVQVYDFDVQDEMYYMVMELLEGDTLKAHLNAFRQRGEHLPLGEVVRILNDVLAGLSYAHGEGVIHRDLKPANIMLTRKGQAVLTDFGIAQIVGGTQYTISGALMGTLNYMAPEQGRDGKCDVRSDIYSLGIVFFEMLTGTVPFDADTPLAILMKHINDPLPMPHKIDPNIPEPFERVALKALAKNPGDRYQTAVEMTAALNEAAQQAGVEVPGSVTLPVSAPLSPLRPGPVAVFSGTSRAAIPDSSFARDDTDVTVGKKPAPAADGKPFLPDPKIVRQAALGGVGIIVGVNFLLLWLSPIFGWEIFRRSWPLELIAVGVLLTAIMTATHNPWILLPAGIVLGNGLIMTYYVLTGFWTHWAFCWPLEPLLVGGSIIAPFILKQRAKGGQQLVHRIGMIMLASSAVTAAITLIAAIGYALRTAD